MTKKSEAVNHTHTIIVGSAPGEAFSAPVETMSCQPAAQTKPCIDGRWQITEVANGRNMAYKEQIGTKNEISGSTITWFTQDGPSSFEMTFEGGAWTMYPGSQSQGKLVFCRIDYCEAGKRYPDMLHWDFGRDMGLFTWSRDHSSQSESEGALNADVDRVREQYSQGGGGECESLSAMLQEMGVSQYESALTNDLGVTEAADLEYITAEDLAEIGIRGPKARRFLAVQYDAFLQFNN